MHQIGAIKINLDKNLHQLNILSLFFSFEGFLII